MLTLANLGLNRQLKNIMTIIDNRTINPIQIGSNTFFSSGDGAGVGAGDGAGAGEGAKTEVGVLGEN